MRYGEDSRLLIYFSVTDGLKNPDHILRGEILGTSAEDLAPFHFGRMARSWERNEVSVLSITATMLCSPGIHGPAWYSLCSRIPMELIALGVVINAASLSS